MDLAQQIAGTLAGRDPKIEQRTDYKAMVKEVLDEQARLTKRQRLTWSENQEVVTSDPGDRVGLWNTRMAYQRIGEVVIQNRKILYRNGREFPKLPDGKYDLSDLSDEPQVWQEYDGRGRPIGPMRRQKSVRQLVSECFARHCAEAIEKNPLVCPVDADYLASDMNDWVRHLGNSHPDRFAQIMGWPSASRAVAPAAESPRQVETLPQEFSSKDDPLSCCGKTYDSSEKLKGHQAKAHPPAA